MLGRQAGPNSSLLHPGPGVILVLSDWHNPGLDPVPVRQPKADEVKEAGVAPEEDIDPVDRLVHADASLVVVVQDVQEGPVVLGQLILDEVDELDGVHEHRIHRFLTRNLFRHCSSLSG